MLVFSTRLPLKKEVTQEECVQLFVEWITGSPNYPVESIEYDVRSREDFEINMENITFSIRHLVDTQIELAACRLENRESDTIWNSDCIFLCENSEKSLLIQLYCNRIDFSTQLPQVRKPYIVKLFIEKGYCRDDADIPVCDVPIDADNEYYDICVGIMRGTYQYSMPVVYISCDYWGKTVISPKYLAEKLGGVAHVFVEKSHETALRLRADTEGNNAYTGYVGVYFPGTNLCQRHGLNNYRDFKEMTAEIIDSVWKALINRLDSSVYNWNQIIALQSRQKMSKWQDISAQNKEMLSLYMATFDQENESLRNQIQELNRQVFSLQAQRDNLRVALDGVSEESLFYKVGKEPCLYPSERNDLLYSILSQVQDKYPTDSRAHVMIQSLLEANPKNGEWEHIISEIQNIFSGEGKLSKASISRMKELGFSMEEDTRHYKFTFHDPRYLFTISKTPGDHRNGRNMITDIRKRLDIEWKI